MPLTLIREAQPKDTSGITTLLKHVCKELQWNYTKDFLPEDSISTHYQQHNGKLFVAIKGKKVIGTIGYFSKKKEAMLLRFYLYPKYRRQGIGKKLYRHLIKELHKNKIRRLSLATANENIPHLTSFLNYNHYHRTTKPKMTPKYEKAPLYYKTRLQA